MSSRVKTGARQAKKNINAAAQMKVRAKKRPAREPHGRKKATEEMTKATGISPSFICAECGYCCDIFHVTVADIHSGTLCYIAKCPRCGSAMVKPFPGFYEHDLRISTGGNAKTAPEIIYDPPEK